jgi:hypothetical protein
MTISTEKAGRIAAAVRTIATATSSRLGSDCIWHALACRHLLAREGIDDARLAAGYAAWRVDGKDPGAVVCHHVDGVPCDPGSGGLAFHAWVSCGRQVFDATTYQLRRKMAAMDAADGGRTQVAWCPEYLVVDGTDCQPWQSVRDGFRAGLFCYDAVPAIAERVAGHPDTQLDAEDIVLLEQVYARVKDGSRLVVIGPYGIAATA